MSNAIFKCCCCVFVLVISASVGCNSGISVDHEMSKSAPEVMSTYKWIEKTDKPVDPRINAPYLDELVKTEVDKQLAEKGYTKVRTGVPSFTVNYCAVVKDQVDSTFINSHMGMYVQGNVDQQQMDKQQLVYETGALIIDVASPGRPELYWRGSAKAVVDQSQTREQRDERIKKAIDMILEKFPDQARKK